MPIYKSSLNSSYPSGTTAQRPSTSANGSLYFNTDIGCLQIYTPNGWFVYQNPAIPAAPTSVTSTNYGSGRDFNNGKQTVTWTPNATGGIATSFTVSASPSVAGSPFSGITTNTLDITGLSSSTNYTYTVTATNLTGTSSASAASSAVLATTVPTTSIPSTTNTLNTAYGSAPSQVVSWSAPSNGGSTILDYTITRVGGTSQTVAGTSATFTGLSAGTGYTYTLVARNANGSSVSSSASSSVIAATVPQAPTIGTATAGVTPTVTWSAPANNGGSAITGYIITPYLNGTTAQATTTVGNVTSSSVSTGISVGNNYTFKVIAINAIGNSSESSASNSVTSTRLLEYLIVAGGGGGGHSSNDGTQSSGGGAGGLLYSSTFAYSVGTAYSISIGAGGPAGNSNTGSDGTNTTAFNLTALKGGFGGGGGGGSGGGGNGTYGSGGGQGGSGNPGSQAFNGYGTPGQGNNGGTGTFGGGQDAAGGGGGAGGSGGNASGSSAGAGGVGLSYSITGTSIGYAGGGGNNGNQGFGGGFNGGGSNSNGLTNRGGGGKGTSGAGGSGVVIVAFPDTVANPTISAGLSYDNPSRSGYKVYRITEGSGTFTMNG